MMMDTSVFLTVTEACGLLRIGRSKLYQLIGAGSIKVTKIGRKTLVKRCDLDGYIERLGA
ncbi:helix-turn-helix domain-containing protein [Cereibacter sphaeroides]|uniref:excisionase family DNA-binding protein n=1 Tax=Cereibacter sphaeroides TaxID=1063 RepID=UPI000E5C1F81|nr:excisionase family DNA-binding protein [Cereibacter sphaeroides]RHZ95365.1 helix-turn-helix domain-containing protein [Cereibacter sphaeroides]